MLEVDHLRKAYGNLVAVDDVTFRAEPGTIYGLLGPNGAGKTTIIACCSSLLGATSGSVRIMGRDVTAGVEARRPLGVVPQEIAVYEDLSATDNVRYWGGAYHLRGAALKRRVAEVLARVGLADRANEPVQRFSGGMKRRLNFACGIVHHPKVLLLDEPTVGVDPQSRVKLLDLVREEARAGTCVLYTTHYMEEAEALCDRLGIIDRGRLIAEGTLADLRRMVGQRELLRFAGRFEPSRVREAVDAAAGTGGGIEIVQLESEQVTLALNHASGRLPDIIGRLTQTGAEIRETIMTQPSLEALFIKLTGKDLRE